MNIYRLLANVEFIRIINNKDIQIENLFLHSGQKTQNGLFFCISGTQTDGHNYAQQAVENGAVCLVVEKFLDIKVMQVKVENSRSAMSIISANFYNFKNHKSKLVAITGTNGKTSTTHIIKHILEKMGANVGLIGTEGIFYGKIFTPAQLTTPDPIVLHQTIFQMEQNNIDYIIMEASAHALALNKLDAIMYDIAAITNITQDHLDFFKNMQNYAQAKSRLFTQCKTAIFNADDQLCKSIYDYTVSDKLTLSVTKKADYCASGICLKINQTSAKVGYKTKKYKLFTNLVGMHNLYNVLVGVACCHQLGYKIKDILKVIKQNPIVINGRFNVLKVAADYNVIIDYAHTPDGILNILNTVKQFKKGRIITVFGCGGDRDASKRPLMGQVATENCDFAILTSDNPRTEDPQQIIKQIKKSILTNNYIEIVNRKNAIHYALKIAQSKDIVLILGKGSENYQEIMGQKIAYSDYEVVDEYFKNN